MIKKISKISIISIFSLSILFANESSPFNNMPTNTLQNNSVPAKNSMPKTMSEYYQQESQLKKLAEINPKNYFMLGILYISNIPLKNGKVKKPEFDKAQQAFQISSRAGILMSNYFLAIIAYTHKDYSKALSILENALYRIKNPINNKTYNVLSSYYASTVLDYFPTNEVLVEKSINYITPVARDNNLGTAQYLLANLYVFLSKLKHNPDYMNNANYWLTQTCSNGNTPQQIKSQCYKFKDKK